MLKNYILGIDTSNYTTSLAIVDQDANLVYDGRKFLEVPLGKRGLSQSEAFFKHNKNLPFLFEQIQPFIDKGKLKVISASTAPRPVFNSYMPVFLLGSGYGKSIACINKIPFIKTTHQEGHIMAGIWSAKLKEIPEHFFVVHLSGGTTEIIDVKQNNKIGLEFGYKTTICGKTQDLNAGQFIDRVGVALGLNFPAGKELENLAGLCKRTRLRLPIAVNNCYVSFSGPESAAQRAIDSGEFLKEEIALAVLECISCSIYKLLSYCLQSSEVKDVLFVGGVAGDKYLKLSLQRKLKELKPQINSIFAEPIYSSDNAVGVALLGLNYYKRLI